MKTFLYCSLGLWLCLSPNYSPLHAQQSALDFDRALELHLQHHMEIAVARLAPKLGLTPQQLNDVLTIDRHQLRMWAIKGHVKVDNSICEIEGSMAPLEKSLRAMCLDDKHQLRLIF